VGQKAAISPYSLLPAADERIHAIFGALDGFGFYFNECAFALFLCECGVREPKAEDEHKQEEADTTFDAHEIHSEVFLDPS
jgi:hypothetical protein